MVITDACRVIYAVYYGAIRGGCSVPREKKLRNSSLHVAIVTPFDVWELRSPNVTVADWSQEI